MGVNFGYTAYAMLNSGLTVNLISPKFVNEIKLNKFVFAIPLRVKLADRNVIQINTFVIINLFAINIAILLIFWIIRICYDRSG